MPNSGEKLPIVDTKIILKKPIGTIPKDTVYEYPFDIEAPSYNNNIISRRIKTEDVGPLGTEGHLYSFKLDRTKAVNGIIYDINLEWKNK